jgi:hypothetical protein
MLAEGCKLKNGDLSNRAVPRIVVVFENAIGFLPDDRRDEWRKLSKAGQWDDVVSLFELDHMMLRKIAWLCFHRSITIDVVTFCGPEAFARALERLFDREHVPVSIVQASNPERLARRTSFEHDIVAIYDGNAHHRLVYGRKGVYLTDHRQLLGG